MAFDTPLTEDTFESLLGGAVEGQCPPSDSGLDSYTEAALCQVAKAAPTYDRELVSKARAFYEGSKNGENLKLALLGTEPDWP